MFGLVNARQGLETEQNARLLWRKRDLITSRRNFISLSPTPVASLPAKLCERIKMPADSKIWESLH